MRQHLEATVDEVFAPDALELIVKSYDEGVEHGQAGDLRRMLSVTRLALDLAVGEVTADVVTAGHVQEAMARTPLPPHSALSAP